MRLVILLAVLAACERADAPTPTDPPLPVADHETLAPEPIEEHRAPVEHPPPLPPGAAWFRRLTSTEQASVDWVCRNERADPCWGPMGLRAFTPAETARYDGVKDLVGKEMERHCTQVYGRRRGCNTPLVISFDGAAVTFAHDGRGFPFRGARVTTDWPTATTPTATALTTHVGATFELSSKVVTGSSQCCSLPPTPSNPPANTDPNARMIIGQAIVAGASCGCASAAQRFLPKNVISITRVM